MLGGKSTKIVEHGFFFPIIVVLTEKCIFAANLKYAI